MGTVSTLDPVRISSRIVDDAAAVVRKGGVLLYPTDTIYGLGCDASNAGAVERVFKVKRRPEKNRALVLVSGKKMLAELVEEIPDAALRLMETFWPGALTIIFRAKVDLHASITGNDRKVGIRVPDNRFCLKLLNACGVPVVSTSANISGRPYTEEPATLRKLFLKDVDLMIDAGMLRGALPSTVVDVTESHPVIVRIGKIPNILIEKALPPPHSSR